TCLTVRRNADADGMPWPELRALRQHDRRLWMRRRKAVAGMAAALAQVPSRMRSIFRDARTERGPAYVERAWPDMRHLMAAHPGGHSGNPPCLSPPPSFLSQVGDGFPCPATG